MSNPFIGEIRMFGGNFPPAGWAFCDGELLPISQYDALFNLIGTTYGGDGQVTFALPDLRSRFPMHQGNGHVIGEMSGFEQVTLLGNQVPAHSHPAMCSSGLGTTGLPTGSYWAGSSVRPYNTNPPDAALNNNVVNANGGGQPHDNMSPFLAISFIISLFGIFPSQN